MIKFDADLFRIAYMCASTEETRYYLRGVFVEPCKKACGVTMTATDGHSLVSVYDARGEAPVGGVILSADKAALAQLKRGKHASSRVAEGELSGGVLMASLTDLFEKTTGAEPGKPEVAGVAKLCAIDGSFPDWRRVIPDPAQERKSVPTFNAGLVERMATVCEALAKLRGEREGMLTYAAADAMSPANVWFGDDRALGVIMPLRGKESLTRPYWL